MFLYEKLYRFFWQQDCSYGIWCFRRADDQLSVLPRDAFVDRECTVLNIQVLPPQGQQFPAPQARGQFQIHRREDPMLLRCAQVRTSQCFWQNFHFLASVFRNFAFLCWIHQNQLFFHCIFQRFVEYHMNALHHAGAESVFFQLRLVFLLHATAFEQLVVKLLDLQRCQLFQLHISELRNDVMVDGIVIKFFGRVSNLQLNVNGVCSLQCYRRYYV